ncbi:MAG: MBL fold metallo-hydrolase [Chloroflexi bacterium]|nr:MAG: MBL fold metallo-hydrolase [Chloroflexota bacterium]
MVRSHGPRGDRAPPAGGQPHEVRRRPRLRRGAEGGLGAVQAGGRTEPGRDGLRGDDRQAPGQGHPLRDGHRREPDAALTALKRLGIRPDEVDVVLSTHLHWDHAGGFTRLSPGGQVEVTFPKARHYVQRREWDFALDSDPRSRAAYLADDFVPVADAGLVEFVDGDAEILPGVELRLTGGHTPGNQVVIFRSGELAAAMTGDLIGTTPHLRRAWNSGGDLDVVRALQEKGRLLDEAAAHRWLLVLGHESEQAAGYVSPEGEWTPEPGLRA